MSVRLKLLIGMLALSPPGCRGQGPHSSAASSASAAYSVPSGPLPTRAEAVARADQLAVFGARQDGEQAQLATRAAADLRVRLWRVERRPADALEAVELLETLAKGGGPGACDAAIDRALLEGELEAEPSKTYRELYRLRSGKRGSECQAKADRALDVLAAFRPLPTVLAELEREARADGGAGDAASLHDNPAEQVIVPTLAGGAPAGPVRITSLQRYGAEDAARIVVLVERPTTFDVGFIPRVSDSQGPRLYVDIDKARYKGPRDLDVGGLVERVRIGAQKKGTRVVLDLKSDVYRRVFYLPEPFRLVIDVSKEPPRAQLSTDGPRRVRRVVLDPGHGGHDPGAVGPGGLREKDVTLDIAHRAAPLIARELGVATLLTRDSDDFIPLDERTARANAFLADLFVSIHCNASENGDGRGVMSFVLAESHDQVALKVAARENAASAAAAAELANVMSRALDANTAARSLHFAELLQRSAMSSLSVGYSDVPDRGVKRAGFYVLAGARMPAVLFESSFISHPVEELRLNTGDYRQKLADSIVNAVRAYRDGR